MYKFYTVNIILIFITNFLFNNELHNYSFQKIKDIESGNEEGLIGWQTDDAGGYSGPTSFVILSNNHLIIPDRVNYRINVYDNNMKFDRTIIEKGKKNAHFAMNLKVDKDYNLYYSFADLGLIKTDISGNQIYKVDHKKLPAQVKFNDNFFPLENKVLIYNDQHEVEMINSAGVIEKPDVAKRQMQALSLQEETKQTNLAGGISVPDEVKRGIDPLKNDNKHILINDKFYSTDFLKNKEYFEQIKSVREHVKSEKVSRGIRPIKEISIDLDKYSMRLIGYDDEHNSYWRGIKDKVKHTKDLAVIVFSKYGELLDAFNYGQYFHNEPNTELYKTTESVIAVAPSGDVYFLVGSKEKYTMYKVERKW